MDGWSPYEFSLLSDQAYDWLAEILNAIESKKQWPEQVRKGRSAFLSKDAETTEDPLKYRKLTILPVLYRRWASIKLRGMKSWIAKWDRPEICAGGLHKGAEDGWWRTSLYLEKLQAQGIKYTIGAVDIRKAFDQMPREIIYGLLSEAGMDEAMIDTYKDYLENLTLYNSVGEGIGQPYKQRTGIPQGDPLSMMVVSLYLRPWIEKMCACNAKARTLADDMLIITEGDNHVADFERALNQTHVYLEKIGSLIAPEKSTIMSNDNAARK